MKKEKQEIKRENRGAVKGISRGQGRKGDYGEPTDTIAIRVPASKKKEIKAKFEAILVPYQKSSIEQELVIDIS